MKRAAFFLVLTAVIIMSGCATVSVYEGIINLNTFPGKSVQETKEDIDSAIAKQRSKIAQNPNSEALFARLSYLLNKNKQYDEAINAAKRAIELNPSSHSGFHNLGYSYQAKKQYDDALKAYKKAIVIAPVAVTYNRLGTLHSDRRDYAKAVQAFKKASELDVKNDINLIWLATTYYRMGKYDDALSAIDKAIDIKNYGTMGMQFNIKGEYTFNIMGSVEEIAKVGTERDLSVPRTFIVISVEKGGPADKAGIKEKDIIRGIGKIKIKHLSGEKIKEYIEGKAPGTPVDVSIRGIRQKRTVIIERFQDPYLPLKLGIKADTLAMTGKKDEALKCATESLNSDRSDNISESWAKAVLGSIHIGNGNYDEAIDLLCSVKDSATAKILEATAYAKKGNTKQAIDIYLNIPDEKLFPKNVPLWSDRRKLLTILKPVAEGHKEKAQQFEAQGRFQDALNEYASAFALAMDDEDKEALRNSIFQMVRRVPRLAQLPDNAHRHVVRGELLVKEGSYKEAVSEYKKAIKLAPFSARLYFNTALINAKSEDYAEAIRNMKIYLQAAPDAPNVRATKDEIIKWELMLEKGK